MCRQEDMPRVNTPSVVDLPLSTFPTTAHLTSGVRDTFAGGNRNNIEALGCPVNTVKSTHACNGHRSIIVYLSMGSKESKSEADLPTNLLNGLG
jgi:hypothetical protein